jgi:hypothetical protein
MPINRTAHTINNEVNTPVVNTEQNKETPTTAGITLEMDNINDQSDDDFEKY